VSVLLDANVLIALAISGHIHHDAAHNWFAENEARFATCPITQGSLVRFIIREGQPADIAKQVIAALVNKPRHDFWPDTLCFAEVPLKGLVGHRQVTDAYLAQLARTHNGKLATFDEGLAQLHSDVAELVPVQ
jgi:uncharacterized protein